MSGLSVLPAAVGRLLWPFHRPIPGLRVRALSAAACLGACLVWWPGLAAAVDSDGDGLSDSEESSRLKNVPFGPQRLITTMGHEARWVVGVDLDGDGDPDVLSSSDYDNKISWHENRLGEASADFGPQRVITTLGSGNRIYAADLDGDGDADVLSAMDWPLEIFWHENRLAESAADFGPPQTISTTGRIASVMDLDGDGDPDVVLTINTSDTGQVAWCENRLNEASGDFGPPQAIAMTLEHLSGAFAADLDGDGDADVLSSSWAIPGQGSVRGEIALYENRLAEASADFGAPQVVATFFHDFPTSIFVTDLDGDGDRDALLTFYYLDPSRVGKVIWYENQFEEPDEWSFGPGQVIATWEEYAYFVHAADLDGDGDADVLSVADWPPEISWHENRLAESAADFGPPQVISRERVGGPLHVADADLDGDGDADLLSASWGSSELAWYENPGTHPFDPDSDDDGLADGLEVISLGTDPLDRDSDDDDLADGFEVIELGTDPLARDSDDDGLADGKEVDVHATDPLDPDTDGDGFDDDREVRAGSDPADFASKPAAPQPAMFEASFILHALGLVGPESRPGWWTPDLTFAAVPLGQDCRSPSLCGRSVLQAGHPATGSGTLGVGSGSVPPVVLPQSAFGVTGVTGYMRESYFSSYQRSTYASFANAAGTFFAGGGPAAGRGTRRRVGSWAASWVVREGENAFGGTLGLLGKLGAEKWIGRLHSYAAWAGTSSWNMLPALGRSASDPANPYTNTDTFPNTRYTEFPDFSYWISKRGSGTPWTTGSVTLYFESKVRFRKFTSTLRRAGYDNRNALGSGTIQLVAPALTHWSGPSRRETGHIGILKLHIVPEPGALLLFAAGASALVLLRRVSRGI